MGMLTKFAPALGGGADSANGDLGNMLCSAFAKGSPLGSIIGGMFGDPNGEGPDQKCMKDDSGGTGPYKAKFTQEQSLANHTIYAPAVRPPDSVKLPVLVWSNGFCLEVGTMFQNFLNEIASHGFIAISNGGIKPALGDLDHYEDLIQAIDWVTTSPDAKKYGNIDVDRIAVGGQSCGGLQALAASDDPRVKLTGIFNSGHLAGSQVKMSKFKNPVAWILGGPKDVGYELGRTDYRNTPTSVPALLADIPIGHIGTYYQRAGGAIGKFAVALLKWQFKGDEDSKKLFCEAKTDSELVKLGFTIQAKNGMC